MAAIFVVLPIFIVIALGYFFKRKAYLTAQTMKEINFFLYWIAIPALLIRNIFSADISLLKDFWLPFALNVPPFLMLLVGWFVGKFQREAPRRLSVTVMSAVRSNQVFVGFPIAWLALGQAGIESAAVCLALTLALFQFFSIGGAQLALEGEISARALGATVKTLLKNPLFVATVSSVILVSFDLHHIPQWLDATLKIVADVGTGLALVSVGSEVVFGNVLQKFKRVRAIVIVRLIVSPLLTYFILSLFGVPTVLKQVATILSGTPIAVNSLIVAKGMGMDSEYMTDAVIVTTIISILTLTALLYFMGIREG